ncbi:signal peptide protein [Rhodopirellula maiorica SM1]|uniref:Signal peptide protein n=1 Tax=Rhodopirellula maiorica SM1 TaxID=1265738 RepID=M5RY57_9BACT|nr:family 16 glycoside hydrolase [Rhodopirellula maiorica]EMI20317.1 signal peptide protein [Rhodopirellula maiorica SM1]
MIKTFFCVAITLALSTSLLSLPARGHELGKLIFADDFERNESQEQTDEVGNGWGTNSKTRAGGNKQVDLKDGAMHIYIHQDADHGVSVTHPAEFKNGAVQLKFKLEHEKDTLGLNFADLQYKKVWAGHLFKVTVGVKQTEIADLKTGVMDLKIREARQNNTITAEQQATLKTKTKRFSHKLETGKWYTVLAEINGDTLTVSIDGKEVGSFSSPGIAHPTKRMLRLAVRRNVVVDDVKIYSAL